MSAELRVKGLSVRYGGVAALSNVSFSVAAGTVGALIGPNGAGKSTMINAVTGLVRPAAGSIQVGERELVGLRSDAILRAGVARTFQQAQLSPVLTVEENLSLPLLNLGSARARARALEVADLVGASALLNLPAGNTAFGARRLIEIARALMSNPKVLLLDEPGAGLTLGEKADLVQLLRSLAGRGMAVLLVDHDMRLVMDACDAVVVLDAGIVIATGSPTEVRVSPEVIRAYLGTMKLDVPA